MSSKKTETTKEKEVELQEATTPVETSLDDLGPIESTKPKGTKSTSKKEAKTETTKEKESSAEAKDPVMDFHIDATKTYTFKTDREVYRYLIPSEAIVWDETTQAPKKIVLTDTEDSPFEEDHSEAVKPSRRQLSFVKGELKIKGTNAPAIRYLLAFDGFKGKKTILPSNKRVKDLYYLEDVEAKQAQVVALEKKKNEAKGIILEAEDKKVESFVLSRGKHIFGDAARIEALKIAGIAPDLVINGFENPLVEAKAGLMRAQYQGLLKVDGDKIVGDKKQILFASTGRDVLEDAAKEMVADTAKGKALTAIVAEV